MFIGEYIHTLDSKKRLAIPARFRKEFGSVAILTRGPDHSLFLYSAKAWDVIAEKLSKLPVGQADTRNFVRFTLASASEQEFDGLGRILIPERLKEYAGLVGRAVIVGVYDRVEIWSEDRWTELQRKTEENADRLAERLGELGMF
ncbi:MAG: division/cell wall cluster transcriptional repressor MraZ [Candidatus Ryanbacteria bacterium]|nr:division/cell wall cluster transcriptional repressor MraZ [Candidatus Ryanbacteria bacterium]